MSKAAKPSPAEKVSIEELIKRKDLFLTTSERIYEFFLKNLKNIILSVVVLAAVVLAVVFYFKYQENREIEAFNALEAAWAQADADPQSPKAAEDLEKVRSDYSERKAARLAAFKLVNIYAKTDRDKAISLAEELLNSLSLQEESLKNGLSYALGSFYEDKGDYAMAEIKFKSALSGAKGEFEGAASLALARVYKEAGKVEEAKKAYEDILSADKNSYWAMRELALLNAGLASAPAAPGASGEQTPSGTDEGANNAPSEKENASVIVEEDLPPQK